MEVCRHKTRNASGHPNPEKAKRENVTAEVIDFRLLEL